MQPKLPPDYPLNPRDVIENITLRKIIAEIPECEQYKAAMKFLYEGKRASLDLTLLPGALAKKIEDLLAG